MKRIINATIVISMLLLLFAGCGNKQEVLVQTRPVEQGNALEGTQNRDAESVTTPGEDNIIMENEEKTAPTTAPTAAPAQQEKAPSVNSGDWMSNVLAAEPLEVLCPKKELIRTVTFLDSTEDAPRNAFSIGKGSSNRVKGWTEWADGMVDIYIAADGGINAEIACTNLFKGCDGMIEVNFNGAFHTDEVESMRSMFQSCISLEELDLSDFNTSNVKNMNSMFSTCYGLTELDLSGFDTSKVTNMGLMFSACKNLESVEVSHFDTSNVTDMEGTFRWCNALWDVDVSGWDVSRVQKHIGFMNDGMTINGQPWEDFFN